ncbi:MAG: choice-of-anchor J domain-containing protein, partial [Phycisphaerae bacterium]
MTTKNFVVAAMFLLQASVPSFCLAQSSFTEGFDNVGPTSPGDDGPTNLISQGWSFSNQSAPTGSETWEDGMAGGFPFSPYAGTSYLGIDSLSTDFFGGDISNWAVLPDIPGLVAGDVMSFYVEALDSSNADTLQIRYSPSGNTNTGSGVTDVGDFTSLLLDINPIPTSGWTRFEVTIPGSGRIAFRYFVQNACNFTCFVSKVALDELGFNAVAAGPPLPGPGETVTWTLAGSPYAINSDLNIIANGTVLVDPGVEIQISPAASLAVDGTLSAQGTAASPVMINGGKLRGFGHVELNFTTINSQVEPQDGGGAMIFRDSTFLADQLAMLTEITAATYIWNNPPLVSLDRCTFIGDGSAWEFLLDNCHVFIRDTNFTNTAVEIWDSYVWLDNVSSDGGQINLFFANVDAHQDIFLDNITARNNPAGAGLAIFGATALLGPNNILDNNLYPVSASGLLPGSAVPVTGNLNNLIHANGLVQGATWADLGLPWLYDGTSGCTSVLPDIQPGVTVKMGPAASICNQGGTVQLRGLPDAPIVFEPLDPAQPWNEMIVNVSFGSRIDNCIFDGASNIGLIVTNAGAQIKNCIFQNCNVGTNANTFASSFFENTRFINNAVGASFSDTGHPNLNSPTNPNSFEGNTLALDAFDFGSDTDAANSWWNHPTGPQVPSNPAGQGDPIGGISAASVIYQPFLNAPPDFTNHPPVILLAQNKEHPAYALDTRFEPGSKYIVEWEASDDDSIVSQRLMFSPAGDFPGDFQLVANLPVGQRSYEWTVPDVGFIVNGARSYLRVEATDSRGQVGWDDIRMFIPSGR